MKRLCLPPVAALLGALLLACQPASAPPSAPPGPASPPAPQPTPSQIKAAQRPRTGPPRSREQWRNRYVEERIAARDAALRLLELVRKLRGDDVELVSVVRDGDVRRVTFAQAGAPPRIWSEILTVVGGRWLVNPVDLQIETESGEAEQRFLDCLRSKQVRIFVESGHPSAREQLGALGPKAADLAVMCPKDPACKQLAGRSLPAIAVGDRFFPGKRDRRFVESVTGCK